MFARQTLLLSAVCMCSTAHAQAGLQHVFTAPEGSQLAGISVAADGSVLAALSAGGEKNLGTVARYMLDGQVNVLHSFGGSQATRPSSAVIIDRDGSLYGLARTGGPTSYGGMFRIDDRNAFNMLVYFTEDQGGRPIGQMLPAADGGFFCVTSGTGEPSNQTGKLLHLGKDRRVRVILDGLSPTSGGVILARDGYLYGALSATNPGGWNTWAGRMYRVRPDGRDPQITDLTSSSSFNPLGELLEGPDGDLYGVSSDVPNNQGSSVFRVTREWDPQDYELTTLSRESVAHGGLALGNDGNLYGAGSSYFRVTRTGTVTHIHKIDGDASPPTAAFVAAPQKNGFYVPAGDHLLYMTQGGAISVLHRFGYRDGHELGGLWIARDGRVTGTTTRGGAHGGGTLFEFENDATFHTVMSWPDRPAEYTDSLVAPPVEAKDGTLYGVTQNRDETYAIVSVAPSGELTTLHTFGPPDAPFAWIDFERNGLVVCPSGAVYGAMVLSGDLPNNGGTIRRAEVFRFEPAAGSLSIAARFDVSATSALFCGSDDSVYVSTYPPFSSAPNVLHRIAANGTESTVHDFGASFPSGPVAEASDGSIWGYVWGFSPFIYRWSSADGFVVQRNLASNDFLGQPTLLFAADGTLHLKDRFGGAVGSLALKPNGELVRLPGPALSQMRGLDGTIYQVVELEQDGYSGFRVEPVVLP